MFHGFYVYFCIEQLPAFCQADVDDLTHSFFGQRALWIGHWLCSNCFMCWWLDPSSINGPILFQFHASSLLSFYCGNIKRNTFDREVRFFSILNQRLINSLKSLSGNSNCVLLHNEAPVLNGICLNRCLHKSVFSYLRIIIYSFTFYYSTLY